MAHGVLHRAQQRVRACPRPAPACSCASPVLRDSTAQGCRGHHMGSSPRLLQLLTGTQRLARAALRGSAMCMLRCLSGCGFSQRGWRICASVPTPLEQWPLCAAADGASPGQPGSRNKGCPSVFPHRSCLCSHEPCTPCCTPCRTHSAACHSLPGTQGGQHTALCSGAAVHAAICTAQAALSSTSIPSGTKTVSAAMACQDSPR